jgi:hypothetical protein
MFSGICTRWVPRAQVSVTCLGRSGSASHPSTPAVSDWIQRSFSAFGSMPGLARKARSASQRAQCSAGGSLAPFAAITCTSPARPASEMASR